MDEYEGFSSNQTVQQLTSLINTSNRKGENQLVESALVQFELRENLNAFPWQVG